MRLADWSDPKTYPCIGTETKDELRKWAWEFLRRNPSYQTDFECHHNDVDKFALILTFYQYGFIMGRVPDPLISDLEESGYRLIFRCESVGLQFNDPKGESLVVSSSWEVAHADPTEAAIIFDLSIPLENQLRQAKTILKAQQKELAERGYVVKKQSRVRHDVLLRYLRVLDALEEGVDRRELSTVLFPHLVHSDTTRVRDSIKSALRMRDYDYRYLPLSGKK